MCDQQRLRLACAYAPLQVAWVLYECSATGWTAFRDSKLKRRLHRLVWIYTCQNATLLEITCHGSNDLSNSSLPLKAYVKLTLSPRSTKTCIIEPRHEKPCPRQRRRPDRRLCYSLFGKYLPWIFLPSTAPTHYLNIWIELQSIYKLFLKSNVDNWSKCVLTLKMAIIRVNGKAENANLTFGTWILWWLGV